MAEGNGTKQGYLAVGAVVAVLITLFTLSNLIPFVYKTEFTDFKAEMVIQFTELKAQQAQQFSAIAAQFADEAADRRDLRSGLEDLKLDDATLKAELSGLEGRLNSEDSDVAPVPLPMHKKKY